MPPRQSWLGVFGLAAGVAVLAWARVTDGGDLKVFLQPAALLVVFGGTLAALVVSFSGRVLGQTLAGVVDLFRHPAPRPEDRVARFADYAALARQRGMRAVEDDIAATRDQFLARALGLVVAGLPAATVRQALEVDARACSERDEEQAQVLEAAAGYAPTLGIIGAVLGLMRTMEHLATPAGLGGGIATAFVATIYGIGAANLIFLPLATRLRARGRLVALHRELTIDGVTALRDGISPRMVEEQLAGYLRRTRSDDRPEAA